MKRSKQQKLLAVFALALIICMMPMTIFAADVDMRADVNGDGMVTSEDAIYLLRHVLMPEKYPILSGSGECQHTNTVIDEAKEPTCTKMGLTEGKHCATCGEVLVAQTVVPAKGHNYVDGKCTICGQNPTLDEYFTFTLLSDGTYSIKAKDVNNMPANVVIPAMYNGKAVTSISAYAFKGCTSLTTLELPVSITDIGVAAFYECNELNTVYYGGAHKNWLNIAIKFTGGSLMANTGNYNLTNAQRYYYSETTPTIEGDWWRYVDGVPLVWSEYVHKYLQFTFSDTEYMVSAIDKATISDHIVIPETYGGVPVTDISLNAFGGCSNLTSIEIPTSITYIATFAFDGCTSLTTIYYGGTEESWNDITINSNNAPLTNAMIYYYSETQPTAEGNYWHYVNDVPTVWEGKTATPDEYFTFTELSDGTYSIKAKDVNNMPAEVVLPDTYNGKPVTEIADSAFSGENNDGCKNLIKIVIPSSITTIEGFAFENCDNLIEIEIPASVTKITEAAFASCNNLTSNKFAENTNIKRLTYETFNHCPNLKEIILPVSITEITSAVFGDGNHLKSVYYFGAADDWSNIDIDEDANGNLTNATIYYYSETAPTTSGNYWHYVDGTPTPW